MNAASTLVRLVIVGGLVLSSSAHAITYGQLGARGQIQRMIVNHNANSDEIYVTSNGAGNACAGGMALRTNDPNVSATSFKTLYAYLLTAKMAGKTLEFYTDASCNLFRLEMVD